MVQLHAFHLRPEPLVGVQFGGLGWEALQVNPLRGAIRQERLDDMTAVNGGAIPGGAIPNDDHAAGHLAQQVLEKCDNALRMEGTLLAVEKHLALSGDGGNG
jgi:hypothetical protein